MTEDNTLINNLYLKFPTKEDEDIYVKYQKEEHNIDLNYEEWLIDIVKTSNQIGIVNGKVPRTRLLLTDGKEIFGQVSIRYNLEEERLKKYIGHVGYEIRSKYRNKGYGNLILKLAILKCRELGLKRIMISCKSDNIASSKIIENNGGIYSHKIYVDEEQSDFKIYWINTSINN